MINLTKDQIILLHEQLINSFGGIHGIRDDGLLESALAAPYQSFAGTEFYPGIVDKAVRLGFGLIKNHPFLDGEQTNRDTCHVGLVGIERYSHRI